MCVLNTSSYIYRGDSTSLLRNNTIERNNRANVAVLENCRPVLKDNVIQNGQGRGLVIIGSVTGYYTGNIIRSHGLAGVYVGCSAQPHLVRNIVCESGASGIVVEDCARGCFSDNSMSGNGSDLTRVIRLHTTDGDERVAALGNGLRCEVFELAGLVSAEGDLK